MHANIEQLLKIRDNDAPDSATVEHVAGCEECASELERLKIVRARLKALPTYEPAADNWPTILRRRDALRWTPRPGWHAPVFGLAASIVMAVALLVMMNRPVEERVDDSYVVPPVAPLLAESQRLEQMLRAMPQQPQVMRAGTAWTISELEDRIAIVDFQLNHVGELGLTPERSQQLLKDRVDLMNSLVQVRYAQVQRAEF